MQAVASTKQEEVYDCILPKVDVMLCFDEYFEDCYSEINCEVNLVHSSNEKFNFIYFTLIKHVCYCAFIHGQLFCSTGIKIYNCSIP